VQQEKAKLHERGLADPELITPEERDDFSGTSAVQGADAGDSGQPNRNGSVEENGRENSASSDESLASQQEPAPTGAYEEGGATPRGPRRVEGDPDDRRNE
jgi:hypothetical protein